MVLIPLIAVELTKANARWLRVERVVTLLFAVVVGVGNMTNLIARLAPMTGSTS
jgi:hypothetical protein